MTKSLFISLLLLSTAAIADIYKHIDQDGGVHYSSQPSENAERIEVQGTNNPPQAAESDVDEAATTIVGYEELVIDLPSANTVVKNDQAHVRVSVTLNPALMEGHKVQVLIDGQSLPEALAATHFTLQNIQSGSHTLQVSVVDKAGTALISAGPVQFTSQRFSADPTKNTAQ